MGLQKRGNVVHAIYARLLQIMLADIKEDKITKFYKKDKCFREGINYLRGESKIEFKNYLLASKDRKLEIIAEEMENDEKIETKKSMKILGCSEMQNISDIKKMLEWGKSIRS